MSTKQDIELHEGEDWKISFAAHYADNTNMPLGSGSEVLFRVTDEDGTVMMDLAVGSGITVTDETEGLADIEVSANDQEHHQITASGSYFYEIKVIKGENSYDQAEGRLKVAHSLFSQTLDPLLMEFRMRFPEFEEDDGYISLMLKDAARVVDANDSWRTEDAPIAKQYLAAHLVMMRKKAAVDYEQGGVATGAVRMIRIEDRSVAYDTSTQQASARSSFSQTYYGATYLNMLRRNPVFFKAM